MRNDIKNLTTSQTSLRAEIPPQPVVVPSVTKQPSVKMNSGAAVQPSGFDSTTPAKSNVQLSPTAQLAQGFCNTLVSAFSQTFIGVPNPTTWSFALDVRLQGAKSSEDVQQRLAEAVQVTMQSQAPSIGMRVGEVSVKPRLVRMFVDRLIGAPRDANYMVKVTLQR